MGGSGQIRCDGPTVPRLCDVGVRSLQFLWRNAMANTMVTVRDPLGDVSILQRRLHAIGRRLSKIQPTSTK